MSYLPGGGGHVVDSFCGPCVSELTPQRVDNSEATKWLSSGVSGLEIPRSKLVEFLIIVSWLSQSGLRKLPKL